MSRNTPRRKATSRLAVEQAIPRLERELSVSRADPMPMAATVTAPAEPEYLGVIQAEKLYGISRWTWRQMAYRRKVTSCKVGARLLIPVSEIRRVLREGTRERVAEADRAVIVRRGKTAQQARA